MGHEGLAYAVEDLGDPAPCDAGFAGLELGGVDFERC